MSAIISQRSLTNTIQFTWDDCVLYLFIEENIGDKRVYEISNTSTMHAYEYNSIGFPAGGGCNVGYKIPTVVGHIETRFSSGSIEALDQINENRCCIKANIKFFEHMQEILDYIESYEKK